nr:unnamed protein product [Callosobruchus analis]
MAQIPSPTKCIYRIF